MFKRTIIIGVAVAALGAGIGACGGSNDEPGTSAPPATGGYGAPPAAAGSDATTVEVGDNTFTPASLDVEAGETVRFENGGEVAHTVTGDGFDSGSIAPGESFTFKADQAGSISYVCTFHPGMRGTLEVR